MASLDSWTLGEHRSASGDMRPTYRKGTGPGVVLIHELPGMTPDVVAFGDEVVAAGFTVVMPVLFGKPGQEMSRSRSRARWPRCARAPSSPSSPRPDRPRHRLAPLAGTRAARRARRARRRRARHVLHRRLRPGDDGRRRGRGAGGGAARGAVPGRQAALRRPRPLPRGPGRRGRPRTGGLPGPGHQVRRGQGGRHPVRDTAPAAGRQVPGRRPAGQGPCDAHRAPHQDAVDRVLAFFGERLRG